MHVVFDRFTFDSERRQLLDRNRPVHLGPKAYRLLEILIENRPRAIAKEELCAQIWEETFVEESNLAGLVNELRDALGDQARNSRFIRTVHGFGYAFCGETAAPAAFVLYQGRQIPLREGANVLGRDASAADVQIDHITVSRRHAAIHVESGGAHVEDLASKNGTFIDGEQLTGSAPLREGQTVVLGDAPVVFRTTATAGSTASISRLRKGR